MKLKEFPISLYSSIKLRYGRLILSDDKCPVIVSLTSIPSRLLTLDIVISSLLTQNKKPELIVLWLNEELREKLPLRLINLQTNNFEIRYCKGKSSYRKLLPSLKCYPNSTIVTCDDDMIYPKNWLENLYNCHLKNQEYVVSQVGRLIKRDEKSNNLFNYKKWPFIRNECSEINLLPIGYGGILYPPNTFDDRIFENNIYENLTPKADDLWFKAMGYLNGKITYCASEKAQPIPIIRSQKTSLNSSNIQKDENKSQWSALCKEFPDLKKLG